MDKTDFNKKFKSLNNMLLNLKFIFKNPDLLCKKSLKASKVKEPWSHPSDKENRLSSKEVPNFKKKNLRFKKENKLMKILSLLPNPMQKADQKFLKFLHKNKRLKFQYNRKLFKRRKINQLKNQDLPKKTLNFLKKEIIKKNLKNQRPSHDLFR